MKDEDPVLGKDNQIYSDQHTEEDNEFRDSMSARAFPRTVTNTVIDALEYFADVDAEWTRELLKEYGKIDDQGPDGDVPEQPPFAKDTVFWLMAAIGSVIGIFLGLAGLIFLNIIDEVPNRWVDTDSFENPDDGKLYAGKKYWVLVSGGTGLVVGIIRWATKYPDNLPGFFKEITTFHVDPTWALHTVLLSAISVAGGANLGPEQALGNLGGGLATVINKRIQLEDKDHTNLLVLVGMAGAMGCLFPTPVLAVLMIHELGAPPKSFMESTLLMGIPAIISFIVFYALEEKTYLERLSPFYQLSMNWDFQMWQCGTAVIIGLVSSASSLCLLLGVGIVKQILLRIKDRCDRSGVLSGTIVIATIGGVAIGFIEYVLPLAVGNGHQSFASIIKNVNVYSTHLLLCTAFARAFTLAISMNCGFVGGFVFPIISIGIIAGVIAHQQYDYIPLGMSITCFLAAMPSAICPMPFTLFGIATSIFFLGLQQTVPIFISCVTAYLMFTGIGVMGALQNRANKAAKDRAKGKVKIDKEQALSPYTKKSSKFVNDI
mmetsp:Transcript_22329/g.32522  ORF Transcript_22329/g.32522 Transcript_22329/m.32522 type:complete len:546 (-) Transcript_22329:316-1953(-)